MGIFDLSLSRPRVSRKGFRQVRSNLRRQGFSRKQVKEVEQLFQGDLHESGSEIGIDRKELAKGIEWMKENPSAHGIPADKIDVVEQELRGRVK